MDIVKVPPDSRNETLLENSPANQKDTNVNELKAQMKPNATALNLDNSLNKNLQDTPQAVPLLDNSKVNTNGGGPLNNNPLTIVGDKKKDEKESPKIIGEAVASKGATNLVKDSGFNANLVDLKDNQTSQFSTDKDFKNGINKVADKDGSKTSSNATGCSPGRIGSGTETHSLQTESDKNQRPLTPYVKEIDERKHKPVIDVERNFSASSSFSSHSFSIQEESSADVSPRKPENKTTHTTPITSKIDEPKATADVLLKASETLTKSNAPSDSLVKEDNKENDLSKKEKDLGTANVTVKTDIPGGPSQPIDKKQATPSPQKDIAEQTDKVGGKLEDTGSKTTDLFESEETPSKKVENKSSADVKTEKEKAEQTEPPKESPHKDLPEKEKETEPVVEELVTKKEIPGTGRDDRLIDEWRKSEEETKEKQKKKEKEETKKDPQKDPFDTSFMDEIVPGKPEKKTGGSEDIMSDLMNTFDDFAIPSTKQSPKKKVNSQQCKESETKKNKESNQETKKVAQETQETKAKEEVKEPTSPTKDTLVDTRDFKGSHQDVEEKVMAVKQEKVESSTTKEERPETGSTKRGKPPQPKSAQKEPRQETTTKRSETKSPLPQQQKKGETKETKQASKAEQRDIKSSKLERAKLKQEKEMKEHHKQIVKAVRKLLPGLNVFLFVFLINRDCRTKFKGSAKPDV